MSSRRTRIPALLFFVITALAPRATAAVLDIDVQNEADLNRANLNRFLITLQAILASAGASPRIRICKNPSADLCARRQNANRKSIHLSIARGAAPHSANRRRSSLGQSVVNEQGGQFGALYIDSVKEEARAANVPWTILAGYVAAHEIGHLLLGSAHSLSGVMKANWDARDMLAMYQNSVHFSEVEGRSIAACCGVRDGGGVPASR